MSSPPYSAYNGVHGWEVRGPGIYHGLDRNEWFTFEREVQANVIMNALNDAFYSGRHAIQFSLRELLGISK